MATQESEFSGRRRRPQVLIVDDDPGTLSLLHGILNTDYDVSAVTSGEEALSFLRTHAIDLVLLDILMPGMDGVSVCRKIIEDPMINEIPVLFVTAMDDAINEEMGFQAGAADYIPKPIKPRVVQSRVKLHLKNYLYTRFLEDLLEEKGFSIDKKRQEIRELLASS